MEQTAVEWLVEQFNLQAYIPHIEQAKEMEKQQIIDADLNGSVRTANALDFKISPLRTKELAEQYYNETFNK